MIKLEEFFKDTDTEKIEESTSIEKVEYALMKYPISNVLDYDYKGKELNSRLPKALVTIGDLTIIIETNNANSLIRKKVQDIISINEVKRNYLCEIVISGKQYDCLVIGD